MIENERKVVAIFDESHHFKGGKSFTRCETNRTICFTSSYSFWNTHAKISIDLVNQFQSLLPHLINEMSDESILDFTRVDLFEPPKEIRLKMS